MLKKMVRVLGVVGLFLGVVMIIAGAAAPLCVEDYHKEGALAILVLAPIKGLIVGALGVVLLWLGGVFKKPATQES